jgi:hypothetical protein
LYREQEPQKKKIVAPKKCQNQAVFLGLESKQVPERVQMMSGLEPPRMLLSQALPHHQQVLIQLPGLGHQHPN